MQEIATELAELFANEVRTRGLKFHLAVPAEPLLILRGDPNRIGQVVSNLLHNACKFTPSGSVGLRVEFECSGDGRYTVSWLVSDTGIGIGEADQRRLFDVFSQAREAQRKQSGAGHGLSIVKSLAEAMGGGVAVQSAPGRASTFTVTTVHEVAALGAAEPLAAAAVDAKLVAGLRVLVVDDHPVNRTVAEAMLRDLGCDVATASNGEEANAPPAVADAGTPVFDSAAALALVGGKRELVVRLVDLFLEQLDASIAAIVAAVRAGDPEAQKKAAHALKGSAAVIGAKRLRELAASLEQEGRAGRCSAAELQPLREAAQATAGSMRAFRAG